MRAARGSLPMRSAPRRNTATDAHSVRQLALRPPRRARRRRSRTAASARVSRLRRSSFGGGGATRGDGVGEHAIEGTPSKRRLRRRSGDAVHARETIQAGGAGLRPVHRTRADAQDQREERMCRPDLVALAGGLRLARLGGLRGDDHVVAAPLAYLFAASLAPAPHMRPHIIYPPSSRRRGRCE